MLRAIAAGLLVASSLACTPKTSTSEATPPDTTAESAEAASRPAAQANLQTFDETANSVPVKAQYPDTMQVTSGGSSEGIGVFFNFKPQGNALDAAWVQIFLPAGGSSTNNLIAADRNLIRGRALTRR